MSKVKIPVGRVIVVDGTAYGSGGVYEIEDAALAKKINAKIAAFGPAPTVNRASVTDDEDAAAGGGFESDEEGNENLTGEIPEDFPFRAKLEANDISTLDQLATMNRDQLLELEGVGEATADRIIEAREELKAADA